MKTIILLILSALQLKKLEPEKREEIKPGNLIFIWHNDDKVPHHMGIVVEVKDENIYTIEGNTSKSGSGGSENFYSYPQLSYSTSLNTHRQNIHQKQRMGYLLRT